MKARKVACGYCGELRAVRLDGRFREHMGTAGRRCSGGGRVVAITAGEAQPGDVIEFATGRQARVAVVLVSSAAGDSPACYVTIRHDPAGAPAPVLTVCFGDTLVRLAGTTAAVPARADEGWRLDACHPQKDEIPAHKLAAPAVQRQGRGDRNPKEGPDRYDNT